MGCSASTIRADNPTKISQRFRRTVSPTSIIQSNNQIAVQPTNSDPLNKQRMTPELLHAGHLECKEDYEQASHSLLPEEIMSPLPNQEQLLSIQLSSQIEDNSPKHWSLQHSINASTLLKRRSKQSTMIQSS